jgi:hypothetical protein
VDIGQPGSDLCFHRISTDKRTCFDAVKGVVVPTAASVFPDELYPAPRSWAEQAYPKLFNFNRADDDAAGQER